MAERQCAGCQCWWFACTLLEEIGLISLYVTDDTTYVHIAKLYGKKRFATYREMFERDLDANTSFECRLNHDDILSSSLYRHRAGGWNHVLTILFSPVDAPNG